MKNSNPESKSFREIVTVRAEIRNNYRTIVASYIAEYTHNPTGMPEDVKRQWEDAERKYSAIRKCQLYGIGCEFFF